MNKLRRLFKAMSELKSCAPRETRRTRDATGARQFFRAKVGFSVENAYEIPAYSPREVYYTRRMQRVFCARFSADSTFVLSGSEETNIRYDI